MLKVVHDQAILINTYCLWLQITRGDDGEEGDDAGEEGDDDDGNGTSSCSNHNANDDEKADDLCVPIACVSPLTMTCVSPITSSQAAHQASSGHTALSQAPQLSWKWVGEPDYILHCGAFKVTEYDVDDHHNDDDDDSYEKGSST